MIFSFLRHKWWFKLVSKPDIYLKALLLSAVSVGVITAILYLIFEYYNSMTQQTIPPAFHSILGVVLGLLLVFRTNTAYERWWKAREYFGNFEASYLYMFSKIRGSNKDLEKKKEILSVLIESLKYLEYFLVKDHNVVIKRDFLKCFYKLQKIEQEENYRIESEIRHGFENFTSLERIRDTPIPTSYSLHIKVSIFMYFLTLPFGILYETGYWSILLVMILYYVVAGIEIISNEIENPFYGDPNDLPVQNFLSNLKEEISLEKL